MKVFEVLGYDPKRKIPTGPAEEWMKAIGATDDDVAAARKEVLASDEYKTLIERGMTDESTDRAIKNGTIVLKMAYPEPVVKNGWVDRKTGKQLSDEEVKEIIIQSIPYAGLPKALGAMASFRRIQNGGEAKL